MCPHDPLDLQLRSDPDLSAYDVVVVDEVHERHLPCDLLLALLKVVLKRRNQAAQADQAPKQKLRVVLMSATLNAQLFADYFADRAPGGLVLPVPVVEVPGRMYPVKVHYLPTHQDREQAALARAANEAEAEAEEAAAAQAAAQAAGAMGGAQAEPGGGGGGGGGRGGAKEQAATARRARSRRRVRVALDPSR